MKAVLLRVSAGLFLLLGLLGSAAADTTAGRVFYVSGGAYVQRGNTSIPAKKDMLLESGDMVVTEGDGRIQWRLADDSYYALRPNSKFEIKEYEYSGAAGGKSFFNLVAGGFRTLTGAIKGDSQYQAKTPVATMGIRGTDYTSIFCGDCGWAGAGVQPGLYIRVDKGAIEVSNGGGKLQVSAGQFAFVSADNVAPVLLPQAPAVFLTWTIDFEFHFPGLDSLIDKLPRIEPCDVPSPSSPSHPCKE